MAAKCLICALRVTNNNRTIKIFYQFITETFGKALWKSGANRLVGSPGHGEGETLCSGPKMQTQEETWPLSTTHQWAEVSKSIVLVSILYPSPIRHCATLGQYTFWGPKNIRVHQLYVFTDKIYKQYIYCTFEFKELEQMHVVTLYQMWSLGSWRTNNELNKAERKSAHYYWGHC